MRRQHAAISVQQRQSWCASLSLASPVGQLQMRFRKMCHRTPYATVAIRKQSSVGVERQLAIARKMPFLREPAGTSARRHSGFLQQDHQGDGETVIDGPILDVRQRHVRSL